MTNELELKIRCNPNQKPARIFIKEGELPIEVLNGRPGYINLLDALNSWQLVKELKEATRTSGSCFIQACKPGRCCGSSRNERHVEEDLFRRRHGTLSDGNCIRPCPRCGPNVIIRRLYRPFRYL